MSTERMRRRLADERGFSLMEALVATAAGGVVLAALVTMLTMTARWGADVQEASVDQIEARSALDEFAHELRQAYTGDGTPPIVALDSTQVVFYSPDRGTPFRLRRVSYRIAGTRLERAIALSTNTGAPPWTFGPAGSWAPRVEQLQAGSTIDAVDAAGAPTTNPAAARTVTVTLVVKAGTGQGTTSRYQASATVRAKE
jgi:type II secretory pathway component PulJ